MPVPASRLSLVPPYLFGEISRIKREAIESGADVIDLGIGDPDQATPQPIVTSLIKAVRDPSTHRYDESPHGWPPFLRAAADWYEREFGIQLDPWEEAVELIGSKEGLAHLAWTYIEPGDLAIVPNPGYTVYKSNTLLAGGEVFESPLRADNGYLPQLDAIPTEVARRAKLFYVCYPHNPTGAIATADFYRDLVRFCSEFDILLVSDMAYATVCFDGFKNPTALQIPGAKDIAVELHSLSKMFNMTGWRIAFAVGNRDAIGNLQKLKSNIDSKQFPAIAEAGAFALAKAENSNTIALYHLRREKLLNGLKRIGWNIPAARATFYIWAPIPNDTMNSATFSAELLRRARIVTIPGTGYGSEGEGFIRMSLTLSGDVAGERFDEVVRRIEASGLVKTVLPLAH